MLLEFGEVPAIHGFKTELLLEHGIDIEETKLIILNVDNVAFVGGKNDGVKAAAVLFEGLNLLSGLREAVKEELVAVFMTRENHWL